MRIAIVHYHLRPGGVTRVIRSTLDALRGGPVRAALITGAPLDESAAASEPQASLPSLDYTGGVANIRAERLADDLEETAAGLLAGAPDVWHVHNHGIGKHPALTAAIGLLAGRGRHLLLHVHDFAEDGRPANYRLLADALGTGLARALYPAGPHVHYAALNGRDLRVLESAGVPRAQLHLLHNPVAPLPGADAPPAERLILYPSRAIRRKNIGEFLLWASLDRSGRRYALTLAPTSPLDVEPYDRWKACASRLHLPVAFEAGLQPGASYPRLVRSAEALATTSIAEGFGLAFLESWLEDRPLVGRDLPEITADLKEAGVQLPGLYERLDVPLTPAERAALGAKVRTGLTAVHAAYGRPLPPDGHDRAMSGFLRDGAADFGRLDEDLQIQVVERLARECSGAALHPPRLHYGGGPELIGRNRDLIARAFSPARYAERLQDVYASVAGSAVRDAGAYDAARVLEFFLDPMRFSLLRT